MWDAWRAYGGGGTAWLTDESHASADPARDRATAISFAAYRLLAHASSAARRARDAGGAPRRRCTRSATTPASPTTTGDTPAAVGNRIGAAVIAFGLADGSNEAGNYADPTYAP